MNRDKLTLLLEKYSKGQCSPEEERELHLWFDNMSQKESWHWTPEEREVTKKRLGSNIRRAIAATNKKRKSEFPYLKIAASIFIILGLSFIWLRNFDRGQHTEFTACVVPIGKRMKLQLSDGTSVVLNAGSKLRYPKTFGSEERFVELLEGEAFFDVAHNQRPFIVIANRTRTRVLGTAFNIRSYASFADVQITVTRGKVGVTKLNESRLPIGRTALLLANDQIRINKSTGVMEQRRVNSVDFTNWISGKLVFNNESLANVSTILGNTYGIQFKFSDSSLANKIKFSAYFDTTDTFNDIIFSIAKANNLQYLRQENSITFQQPKIQTKKKPMK